MKRVFPVLLMAACAQVPSTPTRAPDAALPPTSVPDTCGQSRVSDLIGQPATTLERREVLDMVRIIRPGTAITKDLRQNRLNIHINAAEIIARTSCG